MKMVKRASTFTQSDVTRALKAAAAAGIHIKSVEIYASGKIVVTAAEAVPLSQSDAKEWEGAVCN
jgi:hypothetical protein